jgi:integrase
MPMPHPRATRPPLTKRLVEEARPGPRRYLLFDGLVHGFALKVEPSGAKGWVVQKSQGGRSVRVTLGTYPDLTVDQARRDAHAAVADLVRWRDVNHEKRAAIEGRRRAERDALTVVALWERYRVEEVIAHNRPATAAMKQRMWERSIKPAIGAMPVRDVTGQDVSEIIRSALRYDGNGNITGGKAAAGNLYRLLHHLLGKALAWRLRPLELGHPLDGIEQPRVRRRERLLSDSELTAFLVAIDGDRSASQVRLAIRLAALTGWRINEVLGLKWEHVRRDLGEVHLPDTKTGFSARPISPAALAVLDGIERRPGVPWVLPGIRDPRKPLHYDTVHKAACRISEAAGLAHVTPHILRHRVTTDVASASPNIRTGMAVTGHKSAQAFLGYVHAERERAKAVAADVGSKLAALAYAPAEDPVVVLDSKRHGRRR